MAQSNTHLKGLNSLRFFAATMVILHHIRLNQSNATVQLPHLSIYPCLDKGLDAVSFFFTLSGFLITYLFIQEHQQTGTIHVRNFYIRRILRIWPVYFLVVAFGLTFYSVVLPALGIHFQVNYRIWVAILLYVLFLPNLMYDLFRVGSILGITWSIGIEEQFYLFWAPLSKRYYHHLLHLIIILLGVFSAIYIVNFYNLFGLSQDWQNIIATFQYQDFCWGALGAYLLIYYRHYLLAWPVFRSKGWQLILFGFILFYYFFYPKGWLPAVIFVFALPIIHSWFILTVSSNPANIICIDNRLFDKLGKISFGMYMYHYIVIYVATYFFQKTHLFIDNLFLYEVAYHFIVFAGTIALAYLSFELVEKKILALKEKYTPHYKKQLITPMITDKS